MKKVKILFADHTPFVGGAELCLARDIKYIDRKRFIPYLVIDRFSEFGDIYKECGVPIFRITFRRLKKLSITTLSNLYSGVQEFKKLVLKLNPDIVLANTARAFIIAVLAKKNYSLVLYIRDYEYPRWLLKLFDFKIDKYFSVSKSIQKFYQLPQNKTKVVYLGSDMDTLIQKVPVKKIVQLKRKFCIKKNDFVVGFSGRLVDWKGPMTLVRAVASIKDLHVKMIIFGIGGNQEGSIERQLHEFVAENNLGNRVFFAGFTNNQSLIYKMMDVFVLASYKQEPFATSMIEAALAGLPIIVTNTGGTGEFIINNVNGLLIEKDNVNQLVKAILRFKQGKEFAVKMRKQAFIDARYFTEARFMRNLETELIQLI